MQFKARYTGELVLTEGPITTRRPIKSGEVVSLSAKTVERFGNHVKTLVKKGMLVPRDEEAQVFIDPRLMPKVSDDE